MDKEKELTGSAGSIVYAWDVVNEYLHRQSFARTWTNIYKNSGDSPSYVKKAFELAYGMFKAYNVQDKVSYSTMTTIPILAFRRRSISLNLSTLQNQWADRK